jgi:hypothetical protein
MECKRLFVPARELCLSTGSVTATKIKSRVVIEPGASPIYARMRAALDELDEGDFTEGHELDRRSVERHCQRSAKLTI